MVVVKGCSQVQRYLVEEQDLKLWLRVSSHETGCVAMQMGIWLLDRVSRSLNLSLLKRILSKVNRESAFYLIRRSFDIEIKGLNDGGQKLQSPR